MVSRKLSQLGRDIFYIYLHICTYIYIYVDVRAKQDIETRGIIRIGNGRRLGRAGDGMTRRNQAVMNQEDRRDTGYWTWQEKEN